MIQIIDIEFLIHFENHPFIDTMERIKQKKAEKSA